MKAFQNMKIRTKLILGFLIVAILALVLGVMSIYGLNTLSNNETELYEKRVQALYQAEETAIALHQQRIAFGDMEIFLEDAEKLASSEERLARYKGNFSNALEAYKEAIGEEDSYYTGVKSAYENEYLPVLDEYEAAIGAGDLDRADELLEVITGKVDLVEEAVGAMVTATDEAANATQASDTALANTIMLIVIILAVVAVATGIGLALYNANLIATPTGELVKAAAQISQGDLDVDIRINRRDEIGILAESFKEMAAAFREQATVLAAIAGGDYTGTIAVRSEKDQVNRAISAMLDNNNAMITEIRTAAEQVAAGSVQIADGAQSLATGSTEQAATLQEFLAAISQLQVQADDNNGLARKTLEDTEESGRLMGESLGYMDRMTAAMQTINESSQNIAKVIKVIDDIAFQTNILALNAAVEAARAGQHGKGFAVVADEVRNLASKSAAAAKETAGLIEASVQNVNEGTSIAQMTGESLAKVGEIAAGNATAMAQMSDASQQQSVSITEINQGIAQISSVVQANSATAEESAASAEELSAQSTLLNKTVERFKLRASAAATPASAVTAVSRPVYNAPALPENASGSDHLF